MAPPPPPNQQPMEHQREPCPDRILDDIGGAFAMGAVGGGLWHFVKGMKNSPSGYRVRGALESLRRESPKLGGSFANWGFTFAMFDCTLQAIRRKEDPWNAIGAGAMTGGFLQLRFGLKSAGKSALFGGFLLAMIEGVGIALGKLTSPPPPGVPMPAMAGQGGPGPMGPGMPGTPGMAMGAGAPVDAAAAGGGSGGGFFGSLFGSAPAPPPPAQVVDLTEDPFAVPALPKEFVADSFKSQ